MAVLLVLAVFCFGIPIWIARRTVRSKGGDPLTGTLLGLFLSWLGVIVALLMPYRPGFVTDPSAPQMCPEGHENPPDARRCAVCGSRTLVRF